METFCFEVNSFNSSRDWEYEEEDDNFSEAGNIGKCYDFWETDLKTSSYVLATKTRPIFIFGKKQYFQAKT